MTFSLRPTSPSRLPLVAASVRTRVVSWKLAAAMKLSVDRLAFVMPSRMGAPCAGFSPLALTRSFSWANFHLSTCMPMRNSVSPGSSMRTLRSICRTMTSTCLSLIFTPCDR